MANPETPKPAPPADEPESQGGVIERERAQRNPDLRDAREFLEEKAEAMKKAVDDVVKAYNEHVRKGFNRTVYPEFDPYGNEAFTAFHQEAVIREFFERYNAGDDQVKKVLIRGIAEVFDTATNGKPYQYLLRRKLLHLVPRDNIRDGDGRAARTQADFERNMREQGLNTTYSPDGTKFIVEYSEFLDTSDKEITEAFRRASQSPHHKLEDWFDPRRSSGLEAADVANQLGEDFYQNEHVQALKQLYFRARYVERGAEVFFIEAVHKWIKNSGFHPKERSGEITVREAILDHEPRRR